VTRCCKLVLRVNFKCHDNAAKNQATRVQLQHSKFRQTLPPPLAALLRCLQTLDSDHSQAPEIRIPLAKSHLRASLANQYPGSPHKLGWSTTLKDSQMHSHQQSGGAQPLKTRKCTRASNSTPSSAMYPYTQPSTIPAELQ
jgi:hypothetical protein